MKILVVLPLYVLALCAMECNAHGGYCKWKKLNSNPVCFGARFDKYGSFPFNLNGKLAALKLVHRDGKVSCYRWDQSSFSNWGCGLNGGGGKNGENIFVVITKENNEIILPLRKFIFDDYLKKSKIDCYTSFSKELVFEAYSEPVSLTYGQKLRLWYGEDLMNRAQEDNGGEACVDVYAELAH